MLQLLSLLQPCCRRIRSIAIQLSFKPLNQHFSTETAKTPPLSNTNRAGIVKSVISKCSNIWDAKKGEKFTSLTLTDYILRLSNIHPEIVRRFWRVSVLNPDDVLEILLGFESKVGKDEIEVKKVESLWGIFKWASVQTREFEHLPLSCKIMASLLVRVGLFREVEYLLSRKECQGVLLDSEEVLSNLIEGYVGEFELERAVSIYERMRGLRLVPSVSSYEALIKYLVEINEVELMYRVYLDWIEVGLGGCVGEKCIHENVIRVLCIDGKVQEARDLVKRVGIEPSDLVVNAIISGYCEKKDYDDLLSFFTELRFVPDVIHGNKILFSVSRNFGVERASMFLQKLEDVGFCPDEISLGMLIGSSCSEGKVKIAFFYISDIVSKGLKPPVHSYNALLSGIFKEGMWMLVRELLVEMKDMGVTPNLSTFRVLLAGFCKARQFDEVKAVVCEMADQKLVKLSSLEDPVAKGFTLLGLNVTIRRDNDKGLSKTEFYDKLGNGLYLDTNMDEYEKRITQVLDDAMVPDFNSYIIEKLHSNSRDVKDTLKVVDEMKRWGQEMSLPALSSLLSCLSRAPFGVKIMNHYLEVMTKSTYQLDQSTLNTLVHTYSRKGLSRRARAMFDGMVRRGYTIDNDTYSALLLGICKKRDLRSLCYYLKLAQESNWSPEVKDGKALVGYLCKNKWYKEALKLFETLLFVSSSDISDIFHTLIEELCLQGFTSHACILVDEVSNLTNIFSDTAYTHILNGFCKEKRFTEAFKVFEAMISRNLTPPMEVSIQLMSRLCRINYEKAVWLKNICLRDYPSSQLPILCAFINGLCTSGRIEEATGLFNEVLSKGFVPDADILNVLIEGYCLGNNLKKIEEVLGVMMRNNLSISSSSYSNMMRFTCSMANLSFALSLKELMLCVTQIPELVLYNIIIFHLRSRLLLDTVIDALERRGLQFDNVTYNYVIRGYVLSEDVPRSIHYLTAMIRQDLRPSNRSLRGVITCLCQNGQVEEALNLSREMESRGWVHGSVIQSHIVQALLTNSKLDEAVEFLDRILLKDLTPDNVKYDYLIKQFYQHNRVDKAVDLLNVMLSKGSPPDFTSYDYVIRGLCDGQKLDAALDFHSEMLYRDLKPSMVSWDSLIGRLSEYGRLEEAEYMLRWMMELGETPSCESFRCVINKYRSERNVNRASQVLKMMQDKGYEPDFETHWSVISNLSNSSAKDESHGKSSFLSTLLSGFGFVGKKTNSKAA